jgi:hypothetical protein
MADYEEVQETIEKYMKSLFDKKTKERFKLIEELRGFLFKEPNPPYLNLDQIDYLLIGEETTEVKGLCYMCTEKSSLLKSIKRSSANALHLIHSLLFKRDYFLRDQVQDEFRGLDISAFQALDLLSHFKELSKQKKLDFNYALDILVFLRVSKETTSTLNYVYR